jgi:DNA-3-methyladenine glycosylase II
LAEPKTAKPAPAETRTGGEEAYVPMGLAEGIRRLSSLAPFAEILATAGAPRFRRRRNGFASLLHTFLGQQVSIDAAAAMFARLSRLCRPLAPEPFLALDDETLRSCGFTRQKMGYARHLARLVLSGGFDFARLEAVGDEEALRSLLALKGIGLWSAAIYLLFSLGRPDIWPAADLGLQIAAGECLRLAARPDERGLRRLGEAWRPWRSVAACLFWQSYLHARGRNSPPLPAELYPALESRVPVAAPK